MSAKPSFLLLIIWFFGILLPACKPARKSMDQARAPQENKETVKAKSIRVSFFSRGEGINAKAKDKFLAEFSAKARKEGIIYELKETHWGREGETDFCLLLSVETTPSESNRLLEWCREFSKSNDRIYVGENEPCKGH